MKQSIYHVAHQKMAKRIDPAKLPVPTKVRQKRIMDEWRQKVWQAEHKYFMVLDPIYRELIRKCFFSMDMAGRPEMQCRFQRAIFQLWLCRGSVAKLNEFIESVFNGRIFVLDGEGTALSQNTTSAEALKDALFYNPGPARNNISDDRLPHVTRFTALLGPIPKEKPWIKQWLSETIKVRQQAEAAGYIK